MFGKLFERHLISWNSKSSLVSVILSRETFFNCQHAKYLPTMNVYKEWIKYTDVCTRKQWLLSESLGFGTKKMPQHDSLDKNLCRRSESEEPKKSFFHWNAVERQNQQHFLNKGEAVKITTSRISHHRAYTEAALFLQAEIPSLWINIAHPQLADAIPGDNIKQDASRH